MNIFNALYYITDAVTIHPHINQEACNQCLGRMPQFCVCKRNISFFWLPFAPARRIGRICCLVWSWQQRDHELPGDGWLLLTEHIEDVQSLLEGGSRLWIPEDKDPTKAITGSIREATTGLKRTQACKGKSCATEVSGRPRKPFQGPEQIRMGRTCRKHAL